LVLADELATDFMYLPNLRRRVAGGVLAQYTRSGESNGRKLKNQYLKNHVLYSCAKIQLCTQAGRSAPVGSQTTWPVPAHG
jgi:hypothetical protein